MEALYKCILFFENGEMSTYYCYENGKPWIISLPEHSNGSDYIWDIFNAKTLTSVWWAGLVIQNKRTLEFYP